jgi:formylmethanofuran dehydrogenase subunit E
MQYPLFYDNVEPFVLQDALSDFLGATKDGVVEISYLDCVKLASHSCPTVAGSFIVTKVALKELYKEQIPQRGQIKIELQEPKGSGVIGVIGNVAGFICGASDDGGFVGIGGKFNKRDLLTYANSDVAGLIRFTRLDTKESITLNLDTSIVPGNPKMKELMQKSIKGIASLNELNEFKKLWQDRVEYMLSNQDKWEQIAPKV